MKNLRTILVILILIAVGLYLLERYVLVGDFLTKANAHITEITPSPTIGVPVMEAGGSVRIYLKSSADVEVQVEVKNPNGEVVVEEEVHLGRHNFRFDVPEAGEYSVSVRTDGEPAIVEVKAWKNDRRIFAGLF